jgi:hypothetical protein
VTRCALVAVSPAESISRATGAAGGTTNTAIWPKNGPSLSFCCLVVRISKAGLNSLVIRKSWFSIANYLSTHPSLKCNE